MEPGDNKAWSQKVRQVQLRRSFLLYLYTFFESAKYLGRSDDTKRRKKRNALKTKIKLRWLDFYFHALSLASISSISASDPLAAVARCPVGNFPA